MPVYNLPPLKKEHQLEATLAGQWIAPPAGLNGLAADLKLDTEELRPDELKSVPDAWAQVQLGVQAFFEPGHEAATPVLKQWRGLLALLALQPSYSDDYSLKIEWLELPYSAPDQTARFRRMLRVLLPTGYRPENDGQPVQIAVVRLLPSGLPVGIISPSMLIAPGRQVAGATTAIPWMTQGITDPLEVADQMRPESWDILAQYLGNLAGAVPHGDRDQVALKQKLERFQQECEGRRSGARLTPKRIGGIDVAVFPQLAQSWTGTITDKKSDCQIQIDPRAGSPFDGAILVDETLAQTLRKPANTITVWKSYKLSDALNETKFNRIRKEAAREGVAVLRPSDFFTARAVKLSGDVNLPGHPRHFQDVLVPITPLALLFATGSKIGGSSTGGGYEATLELNLVDGPPHKLTRSFPTSAVIERRPPDDLALWPNFKAPQWPWNFLRYQYSKNTEELRARFALSVELIAHDIREAGEGSAKAERLLEWSSNDPRSVDARLLDGDFSQMRATDGRPVFQRIRFTSTQETEGEQQCLGHGIDAIFFALPSEDGTAPVGCILPQYAERGGRNEVSTVAIDFGTSNTIAYVAREGQASELVSFENRVLFPISMSRKTEEIGAAYADFFPLASYPTPMPTVLKKREYRGSQSAALARLLADVEEIEKGNHALGMSHLVFFIPKISKNLNSTLISFIDKRRLRFEIKWETGADAKAIIRFYLRQLMIMIAAEVVAAGGDASRIRWRMSFPRAFSPSQVQSFQDVTTSLAKSIFSAAGGQGEGPEPNRYTEGEAAAAYFTGTKGSYPLVLMLDIGGGTTDIAIRHDRTVVWQGSVQLAARDFFRNYLANNPETLKNIDSEAVLSFDQGAGDADERSARTRQLVDLWIAKPEFEKALDASFSLHCEEPQWVGLQHVAAATLGGLMHYCSIVLRRLSAEGKIPEDDLDALTIFLGGRGSTFFRRFAGGANPTTLMKLCSLASPSQNAANMDPRFSDFPKQEVARGLLLIEAAPGGGTAGPAEVLPLGLDVHVRCGDARKTYSADQAVESLPSGARVDDVDMAEFHNFLSRLKSATGLSIDVSSASARTEIEMRARNQLGADLRTMPADATDELKSLALEPPFLSALRGLIGVMAGAVDHRSSLNVRDK